MKWEPKPYFMRGWNFDYEDGKLKVYPEFDELKEKISDAAKQLAAAISKSENFLTLQCLNDDALVNLQKLIKTELERRKQMRKEFEKIKI